MKFSNLAVLASASVAAARKDKPDERTFAVLRFTDQMIVQTRADPIVSPGQPSSHVHHVLGGSGFSMSSTGKDLMASNCTNALIKGDKSNYWFPSLYFRDPKTGMIEDVKMFYANAYYFFDKTKDDIKAFPVGLSILVGDPFLRTPSLASVEDKADAQQPGRPPVNSVRWTCPRKNFDPPSWPKGSDGKLHGIPDPNNKGEGMGFPDANCDGYAAPLRGDIHFPSCYNPAAGLTNYKQNMAFPTEEDGGYFNCPKGWIHVPQIFLEVYWDTLKFQDRWAPGKDPQPFVLAEGDATGYSNHADFMAGWDEALLQNIIDHCDAGSNGMDKCPGITADMLNTGNHCTINPQTDEQVTGVMKKLPGDNPITGWSFGGVSVGSIPDTDKTSSGPAPAGSSATNQGSGSSSAGSSATNQGQTPKDNLSNKASNPQPAESPKSSSSSSSAAAPAAKKLLANNAAAQPAVAQTTAVAETAAAATAAATQDSVCKAKLHTVYQTVTVTAAAPGETAQPSGSNSTRTVGGFQYAGCFRDSKTRALDSEIRANLGPVSNEKCVNHCKTNGFSLAGTEYGGQCYCGNELKNSEKIDSSYCNKACEGNKPEMCGGSWALSVFSQDGLASLSGSKTRRNVLKHFRHHRSLRR